MLYILEELKRKTGRRVHKKTRATKITDEKEKYQNKNAIHNGLCCAKMGKVEGGEKESIGHRKMTGQVE